MDSKHFSNSARLINTGMNLDSVYVSSDSIAERSVHLSFKNISDSPTGDVFLTQEIWLTVEQAKQALEGLVIGLAESDNMGEGQVFESFSVYDLYDKYSVSK
jgi:hypothetical protein